MTGLTRALVLTELVTALVAGTMAVREWRRRRGGPPVVARALVWCGVLLWAVSFVPGGPFTRRPLGAVLVLTTVSIGLTWNALLRSRMPSLLGPRHAATLLSLPAVGLLAAVGPAPWLIATRTDGGYLTPGPLGWTLMAWLYLALTGAAALQLAAATQAVGPRRDDVVGEAVALILGVSAVQVVVATPSLATIRPLVPAAVAIALLWLWSVQDQPSRRMPLQVSASNVVDRVSDALVVLGMDGVVIDANRRARASLLVPDERSRRWSLQHRPSLDAALVPALTEDGERTVTLTTGRVDLVRVVTVHELGHPVARILSARDVTELERLRAQLADQASHDSLTGLRNRRHLSSRLAALVTDADRLDRPLAVAMVDLDNLKQLNDRYGHLVGDRTLVEVAEVLRHGRATDDLVVRSGGDEFIVAMPGRTAEEAVVRAEAWRVQAALLEPPGDGSIRITLSVGIASWRPPMVAEGLLDAADAALYRAKAAGRDQVRTADEPCATDRPIGVER